MPARYDVAIVGLGAMGSAAAYELARRGRRVLGIDRFSPPHTLGSSHGKTRIIREAYFEHPLYVPLIQRAYEKWAELERESSRKLMLRTGGLMIGAEDSELVAGARASAEQHRLPHEMLSGMELRRRLPVFVPNDEMVALLEPRAGLLFPEACVESWLEIARRSGAELRTGETVSRWEADGDGVRVITDSGAYSVDQLVVAAGPWVTELFPDLELPLTVERQLSHWFEPASRAAEFGPEQFPIALWEVESGAERAKPAEYPAPHSHLPRGHPPRGHPPTPRRHTLFATFPDVGDGVKIGAHHEGETTDPLRVRREITAAEDEEVRALLRRFLPAANGRLLDKRACLYTNTPDHHFLIDRHPEHPQILIVSPCSGHGFKFASVIGEIAADLVTAGESRFDLAPFRLGSERMGNSREAADERGSHRPEAADLT